MPGAATAQIMLSLLSAAATVAPAGDSDRAGTAGAAMPTERCGAQRTTSRTGVHGATAPPEGLRGRDPVASGDARDCPLGQAATDDRDWHLHGPPTVVDHLRRRSLPRDESSILRVECPHYQA